MAGTEVAHLGARGSKMSKKPYVVVVGTDFSKAAERAFATAYELAAARERGELHVVTATIAVDPGAGLQTSPYAGWGAVPFVSLDELQARLMQHIDARLRAQPATAGQPLKVTGHVVIEVPSLGIVQLASDLEASVIVVGSHGNHGLTRWLLGSVAEGVVRQAHCPVLVVPPEPEALPSPKIEPPCPRCVEARRAGSGTWCAQHSERHGRRHTYHQGDRVSADASFPLVMS
jgi:nucleotide-binding universal stress UspA family protein